MALNPDAVPEPIRGTRRWVVFKDFDDRKIPITPEGREAKCNDPRTWRSLAECMAAIEHGVGHYPALALDVNLRLRFFDLDDCIAPDSTLTPLASQVLAAAPNTYIERSVSGAGLHFCSSAGAAEHR
jgi:primase-polymerase (primpol)-like protein